MKTFLVTPNQSNSIVKVLYGETDDGKYVEMSQTYETALIEMDFDVDNEPEVIEHMRNAEYVMDLSVFSPRVEVLEYQNEVERRFEVDGEESGAVEFSIQGKFWTLTSKSTIVEIRS